MPETFLVETTPPSSTSEHWTIDGPPVPARQGKDRPGVKLRSACDFCHAAKVKCSGGSACDRCRAQDLPCTYSAAMRAGKPKGSCNRKTLDKHARIRQQHAARHASLDWNWSPSPSMETSANEATWFNDVLLGMGLQMQDQNTPGFDHLNYASDPQAQYLLSPDNLPEQGCCAIPALREDPSFETHLSDLSEVNYEMRNADAASIICPNTASLPYSPSATPEASLTLPNEPRGQGGCNCFAEQTESLNRLYSFHRTVQSQANSSGSSSPGTRCRLDVCIQQINASLNTSKSFLSCTRCSKESFSVLLTVSSLQLVMRLYEYVVVDIQCGGNVQTSSGNMPRSKTLSGEHPHMSCRMGDYEVSPEESAAIRGLVVRRALQKGRGIIAALRALSAGRVSPADGSCDTSGLPSPGNFSTDSHSGPAEAAASKPQRECVPETDLTAADSAYLQQVVCRCDAVLDVFLRAVSVP